MKEHSGAMQVFCGLDRHLNYKANAFVKAPRKPCWDLCVSSHVGSLQGKTQ